MAGLIGWSAFLLDALLPPLCIHCGATLDAPRPGLCPECRTTLCPLPAGGCRRCCLPCQGAPLECGRCRRWPPGLTAVAATRYAGAAEAMVRTIKYAGWRHLGALCADRMANALGASEARPTVLVPVPLHPTRLRARGFNQALLLADSLALLLEVPVAEPLARIRVTPPQVGLTRADRAANIAGAFRLAGQLRDGEVVGLVDDVATSGATIAAAAAALSEAGARRIVAVTFALALVGTAR